MRSLHQARRAVGSVVLAALTLAYLAVLGSNRQQDINGETLKVSTKMISQTCHSFFLGGSTNSNLPQPANAHPPLLRNRPATPVPNWRRPREGLDLSKPRIKPDEGGNFDLGGLERLVEETDDEGVDFEAVVNELEADIEKFGGKDAAVFLKKDRKRKRDKKEEEKSR